MRSLVVAAVLTAAVAAVVPSVASAGSQRTMNCRLMRDLVPSYRSTADHLRIRIAARTIDNYLPSCDLVTFAVAAPMSHGRITLKGARWFVGSYDCHERYENVRGRDEVRIATTCVHSGAYASTIWFDTYG